MLVPNAIAIVAAAKLRADEEAKKAADSGKDAPKGGPEVLPPVGLGAPMPPANPFQPGTSVRDILSGMTGVVVDPMDGNFGDLVFVKCDEDGQTYPIRSDQLERVQAAAPSPISAPAAPAAPAPAPASPAAPGPAAAPGPKASKMEASDIVSDPADPRKLTYGAVLETAKGMVAKGPLTASALLKSFGYVPESWDRLFAALSADGVVVLRSSAKTDIRDMVSKGMNAREILMAACSASGPVRSETVRRISAVRGGLDLANRVKAAKQALLAEKPSKPQPAGDPGPGMVWAWDNTKKDWYALPISAAKKS